MAEMEKKYTDKTEIQETEKSMAFSLLKMYREVIKWQLIVFTIIICAMISSFCFYIWLPETEETIEYSVENKDTGNASILHGDGDINNGKGDDEENQKDTQKKVGVE